MEISAVDPKVGGIFYSLDQMPEEKAVIHSRSGLHPASNATFRAARSAVPGHFVRSLRTDGGGEIIAATDISAVTRCTSLAERWGGWYVTS
jgi:hypothetical protein